MYAIRSYYALQEERECIIMLFSTEVLSYHLTGPAGLQEAVNFLGRSFKGGTDLAPCMDKVLNEMAHSRYSVITSYSIHYTKLYDMLEISEVRMLT